MRVRTLLVIGGMVGVVGAAVGAAVHASSGADSPNEAVFVVAGLSIVVVLATVGFAAGWFGRERDDVVIVAAGAGIVAAVSLAIASLGFDDIAFASVVLALGVAIVSAAVGVATWWIGNLICDARDLPTAPLLVAPAYAEDHPGSPLWTTDAGPAIRATLDQLVERVAPGQPVDGRAVGIVLGLPRDIPVVVLLIGDRLVIQPVDINGAVNGDHRTLESADIVSVSMRSVKPDGSERRINAYDDVITIASTGGSRTRLRLPYGTRGVGTTTGGPDVIRSWLTTRSGIAH
jgi:hypothetical protein